MGVRVSPPTPRTRPYRYTGSSTETKSARICIRVLFRLPVQARVQLVQRHPERALARRRMACQPQDRTRDPAEQRLDEPSEQGTDEHADRHYQRQPRLAGAELDRNAPGKFD